MSAEAKFTPLPNPYIVGNPIKSGEMFYGRHEEFLFTKRKIEAGDKNYVIVFCGERRSGKTSILFQILSGKLGDRFLPILIDMQTMAGLKNDGDFFEEFAQEICRTLKDPRLNIDDYKFHVPNESPYKCFRGLLDKIFSFYPDKHLVLMIDEYEMIEEKFDEGSLSSDVITFFAGLLESARHLSFIFTGSRHLEQRKHIEYWRVLFGKSLYRRVSFLSREDTSRLITEPVRDQVTFADGIVEAIYQLTAGQPFYTQVVCQNLLDHLNECKKNHVETADLAVVTEGILQNPLPQMIYIWNSLEAMEKLALTVLAELQQEIEGFIPVTRFQSFLKKKDAEFEFNKKDLTTALEHLYERELVVKKNEMYRIPIALLGQWVQQEYSFWKILQELAAASQSAAMAKPKRSKAGYLVPALGLGLLLLGLLLFRNKPNEIDDQSPWSEAIRQRLSAMTLLTDSSAVADLNRLIGDLEMLRSEMLKEKLLAEKIGSKTLASEFFKKALNQQHEGDIKFSAGGKDDFLAAHRAYAGAIDNFKKASEQVDLMIRLRTEAETARTEMYKIKQQITGNEEGKRTHSKYVQAMGIEAAGERQFQSGDFDAAQNSFKQATENYLEAAREMLMNISSSMADAAKASMLEAKSKNNRENFSEVKYQQATTIEAEANSAYNEDNFDKAVQSYQAARELYITVAREKLAKETNRMATAQREIQSLINGYKETLENKNLQNLKTLYKEDERTWSTFFQVADKIQVNIENNNPSINDNNAEVVLTVQIEYEQRGKKVKSPLFKRRWALEEKGGRWVIGSETDKMVTAPSPGEIKNLINGYKEMLENKNLQELKTIYKEPEGVWMNFFKVHDRIAVNIENENPHINNNNAEIVLTIRIEYDQRTSSVFKRVWSLKEKDGKWVIVSMKGS